MQFSFNKLIFFVI